MRARLLVPALFLLCLPLRAGDPSGAENAIALLKSPDLAARNEGTRLMDKELRRLLAPFLKAMKDEDPEVRRRVAQAILALVPHNDRQPESLQVNALNQFAIKLGQNVVGFRGRIKWNQAVLKLDQIVIKLDQKLVLGLPQANAQAQAAQAARVAQMLMFAQGKRHLKTLGASGRFVTIGKVTGLQVVRVRQNRLAQKVGLQSLDIIMSANGVPVNGFEALGKALAAKKGWAGAKLEVRRGVKTIEITLP